MALRGAFGTVGAVLALAAAIWLVVLPSDSPQIFATVAILLVGLAASCFLRGDAATFAAASVLGWFAVMFAQPFALTTREINALRRVANRGDEQAEALLEQVERSRVGQARGKARGPEAARPCLAVSIRLQRHLDLVPAGFWKPKHLRQHPGNDAPAQAGDRAAGGREGAAAMHRPDGGR